MAETKMSPLRLVLTIVGLFITAGLIGLGFYLRSEGYSYPWCFGIVCSLWLVIGIIFGILGFILKKMEMKKAENEMGFLSNKDLKALEDIHTLNQTLQDTVDMKSLEKAAEVDRMAREGKYDEALKAANSIPDGLFKQEALSNVAVALIKAKEFDRAMEVAKSICSNKTLDHYQKEVALGTISRAYTAAGKKKSASSVDGMLQEKGEASLKCSACGCKLEKKDDFCPECGEKTGSGEKKQK